MCEPSQGYRLPVAAAWPFLGAPVGAGAPTLPPMALPMPLSVAQAATVPAPVHSAPAPPAPAATPAATPIMLAPRHPAHSALPAAVTAQTAATPTTRRRYIELNCLVDRISLSVCAKKSRIQKLTKLVDTQTQIQIHT